MSICPCNLYLYSNFLYYLQIKVFYIVFIFVITLHFFCFYVLVSDKNVNTLGMCVNFSTRLTATLCY